jgi:hypothetical protein
MPKPRSKDPLLAATTSILIPALKPVGFRRISNRSLVRICNDILHAIELCYSGWGGRIFAVNCSAVPLVPPTEYTYSTWGEVLPDGEDTSTSYKSRTWDGQTHERADKSMERIVQALRIRTLPYFASVATTESFLSLLEKYSNQHHHVHFQRACCLVKLQRLEEAREQLTEAIRGYIADGRTWCFPKAAQCEEMLKAICAGTHLELYERWKMETIRNLKLTKIVPHGAGHVA